LFSDLDSTQECPIRTAAAFADDFLNGETLFQEMERNAEDCFLQRQTWRELRQKPVTRPLVS